MPPQGAGFRDDTEDPLFEVKPTDNVYSYFMFIGPTEHKKEGSAFTTDVFMAYVLIVLSFFLQGVLIYTIFNEVVMENIEWQNGVTGPGGGMQGSKGALQLAQASAGAGQCNEGGSLCFTQPNGHYSCAPPSVQLTGRWEELDVDGDGIWTRSEVMQHREELKCKYVVDPLEVFEVFQKFLLKRKSLIWLHPDVVAGNAIHKPYFTYAMGDIVMCGYRNKDMCGNILERGVFDAALKFGTAPRVGTTTETALHYCKELLQEGGTCQRILPSTYSTWRIDSVQQCGEPEYEQFTYTNPGTGVTKSLLKVDYAERQSFERAQTVTFVMFKSVIMFLWLLAMQYETKEIIIVITWVFRFPDAAQFGSDAVREEPDPLDPGDVKYIIQGITMHHRVCVGLLIFARLCVTIVLAFVGVSFLSKQMDYADLLLDGVALIFVVEIATILYAQVLRPDVRDQTESLTAMRVRMYGIDWLNRRPAVADSVWLLSMMLIVAAVMWGLHTQINVPVYDALQCTCLGEGDNCFESHRFSADFWSEYWLKDIPGVYEDVDRLRSGKAPLPRAATPSTAVANFALERGGVAAPSRPDVAPGQRPPVGGAPAERKESRTRPSHSGRQVKMLNARRNKRLAARG